MVLIPIGLRVSHSSMTERSNTGGAITRRRFILDGTVSAGAFFLFAQPIVFGKEDKAPKHTGEVLVHRPGPGFVRRDVHFTSAGAEISAWFYEPKSQQPWPLVIMAHGYSATRYMVTDKYAEIFCSKGIAVLLYDHRGFGDSGGEPRHQINTWIQTRGYLDALTYVRKLPEVDRKNIALWGDSLSSGEALVAASIDANVAALVMQTPALGAALPPPDPDGSVFNTFRQIVLSGDVEANSPNELEGPMPVVSDDPIRRPCALQPLTAYRWFIEYGGRPGAKWVNEITRARPKTAAPWHPGICAPHVNCPSIFLVSPEDEMPGAVPAVTRFVCDKIPAPTEWVDITGGHFGLLYYPGPEFEQATSVQADFLMKHLF